MGEKFPLLKQYSTFLLDQHLDELINNVVNRALNHPISSLNLLNISDHGLFLFLKKHIQDNILFSLNKSLPDEGYIEIARIWVNDDINKNFMFSDLFTIIQLIKSSFIEFLEKYILDQKESVKIFLEIDQFFNLYEFQIIKKFEVLYSQEKIDGIAKTEVKFYNLLHELPEKEEALKKIIQNLDEELKIMGSDLTRVEERFDLISRNTDDILWDWDLITNDLKWNEGFKTVFGYRDDEIEPGIESWYNRLHPDDKERVMDGINFLIEQNGEYWFDRYRFKRKDGSYAYVLDKGYIIYDVSKKPYRMLGSIKDISESYYASKKTQMSEDGIKLALRSAGMGVWSYNPKTGEIFWDERCKILFGLPTNSEINYQVLLKLIHPEHREKFINGIQELSQVEYNHEIDDEYRTAGYNNAAAWVRVKGRAYYNKEKKTVMLTGTANDISDKKRVERVLLDLTRRLSERESYLNILTNTLPAFISYVDKNERYQYANDYYKHWKNTPADVLNKTSEEILGKERYKIRKPYIQRALKGERVSFEDHIVSREGANMDVLINYIPDKDEQGNVRGFVTMGINITDRAEYEKMLKKKNEELSKINADLDNFIYTASHDLRAPVSNIEGLINNLEDSLLEKELPDDKEINQIIDYVKKSISKFQKTVMDLTEISKIQQNVMTDVTQINVRQQLDDILLELNKPISDSSATINIRDIECPSFKFSRINFRSVLYNLLSNAIKYRHPDRNPIIDVAIRKEDNYCVLSVKDNGLGIRKDMQEKAFGMFKRMHTHVEGTGVGLYIVKRIVENSGGKIVLESEEGKGSVFKVYLKVE